MTKRFFLAALTAVALTMGFTACDDDDANDAGKYEMNVFLRLDHVSSDEDESKQIFETYITALGITDKEEMTATVQGKDSLDCVSNVTEKCAKAEAQLDGQQWSDVTAISVSIDAEKNSTELYSKTFGKASGNGKNYHKKRFGEDVEHGGHSAQGMLVQCQKSWFDHSDWQYKHPYISPIDLNEGARGKYVFTMFDNSGVTSFKDLRTYVINNDTARLNQYIADVLILVSDSYHGDFHEFTYEGATYKYAHGIYDDPVMWDMNMGAGGPYLHLFYSTDATHFQRVIDIDMSLIAYCNNSDIALIYYNFTLDDIGRGNWKYSEFVKAVRYNNGNVVFERADGDFNQGAGGAFIRMRADYISFDELRNNQFDENGNVIK